MTHSINLVLVAFLASAAPLAAQIPDIIRSGETRLLAIMPLSGAGTYADPVRPQLPPGARDASTGISFNWIPSDDGRWAIVELSARDRASLLPVLQDRRPGVLTFERGRVSRTTVEVELRRYRKNFQWEDLVGVQRPAGVGQEVKP